MMAIKDFFLQKKFILYFQTLFSSMGTFFLHDDVEKFKIHLLFSERKTSAFFVVNKLFPHTVRKYKYIEYNVLKKGEI